MALESLSQALGYGGSGLNTELPKAVKELQGLTISVIAGAAASTKMNVAALRTEDTLVSAVVSTDGSAAALSNDVANMSIVDTRASGTLTISGNPVADETFVVNGVTYTFKATPTDVKHVKITAGDNTAMAAAVAAAVNAYENRFTGVAAAPAVVATSALGVVTFRAVADGTAGNSITLTEACTNVAVSGSGTLANGTATGGVTSTTNLTGKSIVLTWFNKR